MKKLCAIVLAILFLTGAIGCNAAENKQVTAQIDPDTLTPYGAKLTVRNDSDTDLSFGAAYAIRVFQNNSWNDIELERLPDWTAELYVVKANAEYTFEIDWTAVYGELSPGKYRIVKAYLQAGREYSVFGEFEIN